LTVDSSSRRRRWWLKHPKFQFCGIVEKMDYGEERDRSSGMILCTII